ncbi:hypothetical protein EVJ58_g5541 [Rhodofomes roseus]|uniref:F-box domain-containing protein n=1 Tax=Rhodofomes roseus TaxID=34475 RepID=A0A4Y9YCC2_9APHY|nr:hypothetical protein EVJ58_g5541 [Rhodofomes roseus]
MYIDSLEAWRRIEDTLLSASHVVKIAVNTTSPIHRLPVETLMAIFLFVPRGDQDRWRYSYLTILDGGMTHPREVVRLTHVCQHWRSIAIGIPALWTNIRVSDHTVSAEAHATFIERSGNASLTVGLRGDPPNAPIISLLEQTPSRIKDLRWDMVTSRDFEKFIRPLAPTLEALTFRGNDWYYGRWEKLRLLGRLQPQLRLLCLKDPSHLPSDQFTNLTSLCIENFDITQDDDSREAFVCLLNGAPLLAALVLAGTRRLNTPQAIRTSRRVAIQPATVPALQRCVFRGVHVKRVKCYLSLMTLRPTVAISVDGYGGDYWDMHWDLKELPLMSRMTRCAVRSVQDGTADILAVGSASGFRCHYEGDATKWNSWRYSTDIFTETISCKQFRELWLTFWPEYTNLERSASAMWDFFYSFPNLDTMTIADKYLPVCVRALAGPEGAQSIVCGDLRVVRVILGEYDARTALDMMADELTDINIVLSDVPPPASGQEADNADLEELFPSVTYLPMCPRMEIPAVCEADTDSVAWPAWA